MTLILFVLAIISTVIATLICRHAYFITNQISGEKLIEIDSEKGYIYATTFGKWQIYGNVFFIIMLLIWVIFIIYLISSTKKRRQNKENEE